MTAFGCVMRMAASNYTEDAVPETSTKGLRQAIGLMVLSSFLTSIGDALVKTLTNDISVWQLYVMRALIALPLLATLIATKRRTARRLHRPGWLVVRSLLMVAMWVFFYAALPTVGLAVASAGLYTFPLFLVLLTWLTGGPSLTGRRIFALVLGFAGVLLVLRPTSAGYSAASLLPIGAAVCYALQAWVTRHRCQYESPWMISLAMNVGFPIIGAIMLGVLYGLPVTYANNEAAAFVVDGWSSIDPLIWLPIVALGGIIVAASASMAAAYQRGESPVIATFDYSHLVFAAIWGVVFFGEDIGWAKLGGMAAITLAGGSVLTARR